MIAAGSWLLFCVGVCVVLRNRPDSVIAVIIALRILLPNVASALIMGRLDVVHPSSVLLAVFAFGALITRPRRAVDEVVRSPLIYLGLTYCALHAMLLTLLINGLGTTLALYNTLLAGLLLFFLLRVTTAAEPNSALRVGRWVLALASFESVFAMLQWYSGKVLLFERYRLAAYWFDPRQFDRPMGSLDSPLDLALLLASSSVLTLSIKRRYLRYGALVLFGVGLVITQSRLGVTIYVVGCVYVFLQDKGSATQKVLGSVGVLAGYVATLISPVVAGLEDRLADDSGSAAARSRAYAYFSDHISDSLWPGNGAGASFDLRSRGILSTSLENSYTMISYDFGLTTGIIMLGCQLALLARTGRRGVVPGAIGAAASALVSVTGYSGMATQSAATAVVWSMLGLLVVQVPADVHDARRSTKDVSDLSCRVPSSSHRVPTAATSRD